MRKNITSSALEYGSSIRSGSVSDRLTYLLIGGGIGAAVALLFAPKPGIELRGDIADATRTGIDTTLEKAKALQAQSSEIVHNVKDKASSWYDFAAAKLSSGAEIKGDIEKPVGQLGTSNDPLENSPTTFGRSNKIGPVQTDDPGVQKQRVTGRKSSNIV